MKKFNIVFLVLFIICSVIFINWTQKKVDENIGIVTITHVSQYKEQLDSSKVFNMVTLKTPTIVLLIKVSDFDHLLQSAPSYTNWYLKKFRDGTTNTACYISRMTDKEECVDVYSINYVK